MRHVIIQLNLKVEKERDIWTIFAFKSAAAAGYKFIKELELNDLQKIRKIFWNKVIETWNYK